jgi:glycosyltransferase involved in cell wall biosynthesis
VTESPHIVLDGRLVGYARGIARYVTQLASALAALGGAERYTLLLGRRARGVSTTRTRLSLTPPHHRLERWSLPLELLARPPQPDLLHSVDHVAPAWGGWRSVVTLHDLAFVVYPETHTLESRRYYAAAGESARQAARVIAVSQRTASDAIRLLGVDPGRVRVIAEAAGPAFSPRPRTELDALAARLGLDLSRPYLLFVGTLEPRKNVPLLFETLAVLRRQVDVQLLLVGPTGESQAGPIFQAYARSGVAEHAHFLGLLPEPDLAVLYSHAGAFVFPSLYEGFGLVLLEAMACGAPVVSSDAGSLPEVVGEAGLLLPPHDPERWAAAVARALTEPALAGELRRRGLARAASFSWTRAARDTRDVYREALLA